MGESALAGLLARIGGSDVSSSELYKFPPQGFGVINLVRGVCPFFVFKPFYLTILGKPIMMVVRRKAVCLLIL